MGRGNEQAEGASTQANKNANTFMGNASSLYSSLAPALQSEAAHPAGYSPVDEAAMETGASQSAGGSQASAVGQGALLGARTRNKGAAAAAIPEAARAAGQQLSTNTLGIRTSNAGLKENQRSRALSGLEGLEGGQSGASSSALGQVAANVNADTEASNASWNWAKYILDPAMQAAGGAVGCWIAEAVYGVDDPRTHIVRAWLNGPFRETRAGNLIMDLYLAIGKPVAWAVRRSSLLRRLFRPLFNLALAKATA